MPPTIKQGSTGEHVKRWQGILGITQDGIFGAKTREATISYQKKAGLAADGIVGGQTWAHALGKKAPPPAPDNIHVKAKQIIDRALPTLSKPEKQALQAVALLETTYGLGWKESGKGSNNWGATTAGPEWKGPVFPHKDSRYDPKTGRIVEYVTNFRVYSSPEEGAKDLARFMMKPNVKKAALTRNLKGISKAMRDNRYYLGTLPYEKSINAHHEIMKKRLATITNATGMSDAFKWGRLPIAVLVAGGAAGAGGIWYWLKKS